MGKKERKEETRKKGYMKRVEWLGGVAASNKWLNQQGTLFSSISMFFITALNEETGSTREMFFLIHYNSKWRKTNSLALFEVNDQN